MVKILLLGTHEQLVPELELALLKAGYLVLAGANTKLEFSDEDCLTSAIVDSDASAVIYASAYFSASLTNPKPELSIAKTLAQACKQAKLPLIYVVQDYVGDSEFVGSSKPHVAKEEQESYQSLIQECITALKDSECKLLLVHTSWLIGRFGTNFVKRVLSKLIANSTMSFNTNLECHPTLSEGFATDLVKVLAKVLVPDFESYGEYSYRANESFSLLHLAQEAMQQAKELQLLPEELNVENYIEESSESLNSDVALQGTDFKATFDLEPLVFTELLSKVVQASCREAQGLTPLTHYEPFTTWTEQELSVLRADAQQKQAALEQKREQAEASVQAYEEAEAKVTAEAVIQLYLEKMQENKLSTQAENGE